MNLLERLFDSTLNFHQRFKNRLPNQDEVLEPLKEEFNEVEYAFYHQSNAELAEEVVDLWVTTIGLMMARGITLYNIERAIERVAAKNDLKDHTTHQINERTGKIERKVLK